MDNTSLNALTWLLGQDSDIFPSTLITKLFSEDVNTQQVALDEILFIATQYSLYQVMAIALKLGARNYFVNIADDRLNIERNLALEIIFTGIKASTLATAALRHDYEALQLLANGKNCTFELNDKVKILKKLIPSATAIRKHNKRVRSFKEILNLGPALSPVEANIVFQATLENQQPILAEILFSNPDFELSLINTKTKEHHIFKVRSTQLLRWFIGKGCSLVLRNKNGHTLLQHLILKEVDINVIRFTAKLSSEEVDYNQCKIPPDHFPRLVHIALDSKNRSALHYGCQMDNFKITKYLLDLPYVKKCLLNFQDKDGWTPLALAVENGSSDLVSLLLEVGADPKIPLRHYGTTIETLAATRWYRFKLDNTDQIAIKKTKSQYLDEETSKILKLLKNLT